MLSDLLTVAAFAVPGILVCIGVYIVISEGARGLLKAKTKSSFFKSAFFLLAGLIVFGLMILDFIRG